ncbi:MAG: FprA family A-type flavoprotein, partial [Symbiobacteriaceae bacterium]|nr:FprA family A-type flavoprotein [Symbiobacteriaceae bacterium]
MHCTRQINPDVTWVGANDRRLAMFEGVYEVPRGVSYNSYLICDDDKTVLLDTVDKAVWRTFMENLNYALQGRPLDYLIVQHMEPDHSAFILQLQILHPNLTIVCNERTLGYMKQFFPTLDSSRVLLVKEGDTLTTGRHTLHFILAPMVHWPEVMLTYDATDKTLYSADAFGCFGALNGALYADEVDFEREYMDEMRRYYTNIVGKYGQQVQSVLAKASGLDIRLICPLHGFLWRANFVELLHKYHLWSSYEPEEQGVLIAYASVYGNTENAVEILATCLREQGITTVMYDVSVTPASEIVAQAFRFSHLVFAATTYNAGIFIAMEDFLNDLTAHNIQNRVVALIENGTWAPTSGGLMQQKLAKCKNITFLQDPITIVSSVKEEQRVKLVELAKTIAGEIVVHPAISPEQEDSSIIDPTIFMSIPYGLYLLTTKGEN